MKRLIILLSFFSILSSGVSAQYYCIPYLNADQNPGGLNTDYDDGMLFGLGTWTFIMQDTSGTPVWTPNLSIPFSFRFNDTIVSAFKVSTSGVLTFTTSAGAVPPIGNATLPSATVPNNSVCVLGIASLGQAATIWTDTFGTAPHRQFWVEFADFQTPGQYPANQNNYNFWSIVFEETTNNIFIVDQMTEASPLTNMSLGIQINGSTAYSAPGSPDINSLTYDEYYDYPDDNSYYRFIQGTLPANDIELTSIAVPNYVLSPVNINISGVITNVGSDTIHSYVVSYQNGANAIQTYTRSGVNITTGQTDNFTHATPFNVANATSYPLKVWVDLSGDVNHANDTLNANVSGLTFLPVKNILFETSTGTWCGFCPQGVVFMDSLNNTYPDHSNLIDVHDYDPMMTAGILTTYDADITADIPGFPSTTIDRSYVEGNLFSLLDDYNQLITDTVPVDVSVTSSFSPVTQVLTIIAKAHFATDLTGDFRFAAVVTEDSVHGTTSDWAQDDYFSTSCTGTTNCQTGTALVGGGIDWVAAPYPVPASSMYYSFVARTLLGGYSGQAGSLPGSVSANSTYTDTLTYTVPSGQVVKNMRAIAWVLNGTTGAVLNSGKSDVVTGIKEQSELASHLLIYPNPSTGIVHVRSTINHAMVVRLNVMNAIGQTVKAFDKLNVYNDSQLIDLSSFSNGLYFLQFTDENNLTYVNKIMINR